ncbi:MAG: primosomal protein N' [Spirochaetales bacterium]|nr:primosomal protein N' [Spirochaetales bacterium]
MARYVELAFNIPLNQTFTYLLPEETEVPEAGLIGCRAEASFGRKKLTGWIMAERDSLPEGLDSSKVKALTRLVDSQPLFDHDYGDFARWLAHFYLCSPGEALSAMLPGGRREKELPAMGIEDDPGIHAAVTLTADQDRAVGTITREKGPYFYLQGPTGSGKTEVFLQCAERVIDRGEGVIYLVPEIALTHQMVDSLRQRFKGSMALLHSHLTPSQRLKEWNRIRKGEARFVLGARSAVFAPLEKLGLIILDEEHEGSYKAGSTPRYHARQVAMYRCRKAGARLIMGSATPSLEAWHGMEEGAIVPVKLTERVGGGEFPRIRLVDMRKEKSLFSEELIREITRVTGEGNQVILFLNRRGFSYNYACHSCGYEMVCRNCSIPMTYHKNKGGMVCHYCGYKAPPPGACPDCGSLDAGWSGFGTEQVEEEMIRLFPQLKTVRLDRDSTGKKGAGKKVIEQFRKGEFHVLLGTQMVAKGLNFPKVKLVGIVLADTTLNMPDFRAPERTFALITQVSGRAGRYSAGGEVLIQTYRPEADALALAASYDQETFYRRERESRLMFAFPPANRIYRLVFRSRKEADAQRACEKAAAMMEHAGEKDLLGPSECPLAVVANNHRWHLIIRSDQFNQTHDRIAWCRDTIDLPSSVYMEIDVDPQSIM